MKLDKILVATDFSESAANALRAAIDIARRAGSSLTLLHVVDLPDYYRATLATPEVDAFAFRESMEKQTHVLLQQQVDGVPECAGRKIELRVREGMASEEINRELQDHDLLVLSSHGRTGFEHLVIGSIAEQVLRTASRPTLLVKREVGEGWLNAGAGFLFPTDLSATSLAALDSAVDLAVQFEKPLTVLHVIEDLSSYPPVTWDHLPNTTPHEYREQTEKLARENLRQSLESKIPPSVEVTEVVRWGNPYLRIVEETKARDCSMIVMATHGRTGFKRFLLGSVAEKIARGSTCPLLTIRSEKSS